MKFLAEENFDNRIVRRLLHRQPDLDIIRVQDLEIAWVIVTSDNLAMSTVIEDILLIVGCSSETNGSINCNGYRSNGPRRPQPNPIAPLTKPAITSSSYRFMRL